MERALEEYEKRKARKKLYSKKEVATILDVHPSTITNWIAIGKVKVTKSGKITYEELLKLMGDELHNSI